MQCARDSVHRGRVSFDVLRAGGFWTSVYAVVVAVWRKCAGIDALPFGGRQFHRDRLAGPEATMTHADDVKDYVFEHYIRPARDVEGERWVGELRPEFLAKRESTIF